jgi:hypothetical protein
VSLINPLHARSFLEQYKRLLSEIAGKQLDSNAEYVEAREALYADGLNKTYVMDSQYETSFIDAVRNAEYGMFIYAKKYKQGYALKSTSNVWFFVQALTTPLDDMLPDWIVVVTAVLPYRDYHICDGLIVDKHVFIGKNMKQDMIQELKIEREKWTSNQQMK